MDDDNLFVKWDGWLEKINTDIVELLVSRYIFWEVQDIIKANPRIHVSSSFYTWMGRLYATHASVGIRRQQDSGTDTVTLRRLLGEIRDNPQVLSRDRYVALYKEGAQEFGHHDFDKIAGQGRSHIDSGMVIKDLEQLDEKT